MASEQIFVLQFGLSLVVFGLVAVWYVAPNVRSLPLRDALAPLTLVWLFNIEGTLDLLYAIYQGLAIDITS
jgi:hypothetical protein